MNYMFQSFNFRSREALKPYYDLIANITADELGHVELVSATINSLLIGPNPVTRETLIDPASDPLASFKDIRHVQQFIASGPGSMPQDTRGIPWTGNNVFSSGNLTLDLLHNFFLESGARQHKLLAYEMSTNPVAKALCGYLLIRGGVHQLAYAKALEKLTGSNVEKMLPLPDGPTHLIPECKLLIRAFTERCTASAQTTTKIWARFGTVRTRRMAARSSSRTTCRSAAKRPTAVTPRRLSHRFTTWATCESKRVIRIPLNHFIYSCE